MLLAEGVEPPTSGWSDQRESNPLVRLGKPACSRQHLGRRANEIALGDLREQPLFGDSLTSTIPYFKQLLRSPSMMEV